MINIILSTSSHRITLRTEHNLESQTVNTMSHNNDTKTKQTVAFEEALREIQKLWTGWKLKKNDNRPGTFMIVKEKCKKINPNLFLYSPRDAERFIKFSKDGLNELQAYDFGTNCRNNISKQFLQMYNINRNENKMTNKCTKVSTSNCSNTKTSKNISKVTEIEIVNDLKSSTSNDTKSCTNCTNTFTRNEENCKTNRRSKRLIATSAEPKKSSYNQNVSPGTNSIEIVYVGSSEDSVEVNSDEDLSKDDNYRTISDVSSSTTSRSSLRNRQKQKHINQKKASMTTQNKKAKTSSRELVLYNKDCTSTISPFSKSFQSSSMLETFKMSSSFSNNGFRIIDVPESHKVFPTLDYKNLRFEQIFNTEFTCNDLFHVDEKFGRYQHEVKKDSACWNFLESLLSACSSTLQQRTVIPLTCSILARDSTCDKQVWHRDGDSGYFLLIPISDDYIFRLTSGTQSKKDTNGLYQKDNDVEFLIERDFTFHELTMKKGEMLLCRRDLIHSGGPSKCFVQNSNDVMSSSTNRKSPSKYTDLAFHIHIENIHSTEDNEEHAYSKQTVQFVQFVSMNNP